MCWCMKFHSLVMMMSPDLWASVTSDVSESHLRPSLSARSPLSISLYFTCASPSKIFVLNGNSFKFKFENSKSENESFHKQYREPRRKESGKE